MRTQPGAKTLNADNKGFTLIEVLIAILILSVGLLGMASLTVAIINGNKFSNNLSTATTLAQDKMEDIRRAGYANAASETKATMSSPYSDYKRGVTVTADSPATDMKTVIVTAYWGSDDHSVELKTILAQ